MATIARIAPELPCDDLNKAVQNTNKSLAFKLFCGCPITSTRLLSVMA